MSYVDTKTPSTLYWSTGRASGGPPSLTQAGLRKVAEVAGHPHLIVVEDSDGIRSYAQKDRAVGGPTVSGGQLMAHVRSMWDKELNEDFRDCVLPLANEKGKALLKAYFKARKAAPYWAPGGTTNNDRATKFFAT